VRRLLAARAGVGQERHLACVLDRTCDESLLLDVDTGDTTSTDLSPLGDELAKRGDILVIDDTNADRLRGSDVLAALSTAGRLAAVAARLSAMVVPLRVNGVIG